MSVQVQPTLYQHITNLISQKKPDYAKIKYYPSYKISSSYEMEIEESTKKTKQKMLRYIESKSGVGAAIPVVERKTFNEYGIKDTFARTETIHPTPSIDSATYTYFRREQHMLRNPSLESDGLDGLFVFEMYSLCEEDSIPHIVDYPHCVKGDVDSYDVDGTTVCFTQYTLEQNKMYIDISSNVDINNVTDSMMSFFDSIKSLIEDIDSM